ncbi:MAG: choice-of-anchor Q domain-containing protein [Polyangiaceae bacterium]
MKRLTSLAFLGCIVGVSLSACSGGGSGAGATGGGGDAGYDATTGPGNPSGPTGGGEDSSVPVSPVDSGPIVLSDGAPPPATCTPPITPVDTSSPTTVVGTGTAASCTEAAFTSAIATGGIITFNCGGAATIPITSEKELSTKGATTIDGGGVITLDGGGATRILHFDGGNYRVTTTVVTLQNLTLAHAKATGTLISAPATCSQGYEIDGGGGAILINDGVLHVINSTFIQNAAASPGPDVAGGGIYATGSLGVTIVGSTFEGNTASNGGAVGCLNSDLAIANSSFSQNSATGSGANSIDTSVCDASGGEVGNGGNGGAISIDGGSDGALTVCGATFEKNVSGALGGAMFRTPDGATQTSTFTQSTIDGNTAVQGGGGVYFHNSNLVIEASTISNNSAPGAGGIQADGTTLTLTNDTFASNTATKGLGGAIALFGNGGTMTNCTFSGNQSSGGNGYFAAAITGGDTFTIQNTLFANDTTADAYSPMQCQDTASGTGDLQWPKNHTTGGAADTACVTGITFADPQLGALADNGGPTLTMLPASTSPAAGIGTGCPATDQRGVARAGSGCTAGAVELP